jgi:hypothetical protein
VEAIARRLSLHAKRRLRHARDLTRDALTGAVRRPVFIEIEELEHQDLVDPRPLRLLLQILQRFAQGASSPREPQEKCSALELAPHDQKHPPVGGRKIGKTSPLLELTRRELDGVVVAVLDSFEERPLSLGIFRRLALRVADAFFSRGLGVSLEALSQDPEEYRTALVEAEGFALLPRELRATLLRLADATPDLRLAEISLGLAERLAVALDKHCVVAWDEFQELSRLGGRVDGDVLASARAVWQRHVRTAYFICGSERTMLRNLVTSQRSPFFQHFGLIELGPMPTVAAVDLLVRSAPPHRPIPLDVARKAVEVLGGHPFYLQMFGETLTAKEPPYDSALLRQVFSEMLFSRTGRLSLYFSRTSWRRP